MNRNPAKSLVYVIILLSGFGFLYYLIVNPLFIVKQIGYILLVAGIFFLLYKLYQRRQTGTRDKAAYLRAARQSSKRFNDRPPLRGIVSKEKTQSTKKGTRSIKKKPSHLTVIEGKKGKKKNRAFF